MNAILGFMADWIGCQNVKTGKLASKHQYLQMNTFTPLVLTTNSLFGRVKMQECWQFAQKKFAEKAVV